MAYAPDNPLIVQGDQTVLLELASPRANEARDALLSFAELVKSPEYVHTWRITPLSLWNAAAAGHTADEVIAALEAFAKYPVPSVVPTVIRGKMERVGALRLVRDGEWLVLEATDPLRLEEVRAVAGADALFASTVTGGVRIAARHRGEVKRLLAHVGHPVMDLAGYEDGDPLEMRLRTGAGWSLRDYQVDAVDAFSGPGGGSGVVVLPCGAGKTIVGVAAMVRLGMRTLVLCTSQTALHQWRREILARTTLTEGDVGEYGATQKELRSVTLTTYNMLSWRPSRSVLPPHFGLFRDANWGLVIYDEVHLLPAPIFRETAFLQARRRLGLTATLVREDGCEADIFALVGPKRYDMPWKALEAQGWIAQARCVEVRVPLSDLDRQRYVRANATTRFRIASTNPRKGPVVEALLQRHPEVPILVLGTSLEQLGFLARRLGLPIVTGQTPDAERSARFEAFRAGEIRVLALSKVGNTAIDLPSATVAIQISGTFGSRQEEAQRLGRVLRPKVDGNNQAIFYTVVSADTREAEMAERRQLFLLEQGYPYQIEHIDDAACDGEAVAGSTG